MQIIVMKPATLKRLQTKHIPLLCKFCGQPIGEGDLCVRRYRSKPVYAHQKCIMERRY